MHEYSAEQGNDGLVAKVIRELLAEVDRGTLQAAARLPSEREFADRLRVSRSTVTAAYTEMEQHGILRRLQGKGAFLCAVPRGGESFSWSGKISGHANTLDEPVLELLARRSAETILYPLSAGTPSLEIFPEASYREAANRVLTEEVRNALAVGPTVGQWRMREAIAQWNGLDPAQVMITAGAQEAIDLIARCLIEPGDAVVVDAPTYPGAIQSFRSARARLLGWGTDWSLGQLEELLLRFRPKLIFTMPTFQNPTGRVMSLKTRLGLLDLAHRYHVPVIEDDVYGRTFFGAHPMPQSLYALDRRSQVITMSTFSKILAPGLRVGWIAAPQYMIKQLSLIKMRSNLFTGGFNQFVLSSLVLSGEMDKHLLRMREHHAMLCGSAVEALRPAVAAGWLRCRIPAGGLYLWCRVCVPVNMDEFFAELERQGLSVAPGMAFEPDRAGRVSPHLRLCFTASTRETVAKGVRVLSHVLRQLASSGNGSTSPLYLGKDGAPPKDNGSTLRSVTA